MWYARRAESAEIDTDVMVLGDSQADTNIVQAPADRVPGMRTTA